MVSVLTVMIAIKVFWRLFLSGVYRRLFTANDGASIGIILAIFSVMIKVSGIAVVETAVLF